MTKKGHQFFEKKVTPSIAAPGDTNLSDATGTNSNITCLQSQQQLQLAQSCSIVVQRRLEQPRF